MGQEKKKYRKIGQKIKDRQWFGATILIKKKNEEKNKS